MPLPDWCRRTAYHEAAHGVVAHELGADFVMVRFASGFDGTGQTVFMLDDLRDQATVAAAGQVAEVKIGGRKRLALRGRGPLQTDAALIRAAGVEVEQAAESAREILERRWPDVERLAEGMLKRVDPRDPLDNKGVVAVPDASDGWQFMTWNEEEGAAQVTGSRGQSAAHPSYQGGLG